jgi:hypothetical protein
VPAELIFGGRGHFELCQGSLGMVNTGWTEIFCLGSALVMSYQID